MIKVKLRAIAIAIGFTAITISSFSQVNISLLERSWIAVESRQEGDGWISPIDGAFIYLKEGKGELTFIASDTIQRFNYKVDGNIIYKNDTIQFGKITHLSEDSMTMLIGNNMKTVFLPIKEQKVAASREELLDILMKNAWYQAYSNRKDRIDFFDLGFFEKDDKFKVCIKHYKDTYWNYRANEKWTLFEYKGSLFLGISEGQFDLDIYQITEISSSSIKLNIYSAHPYPLYLEAIEKVEVREIEILKNIITAQKWKMEDLKNYHQFESVPAIDSFDIDSFAVTGVSLRADSMILKSDFLNKKLTYNFLDNGFFSIQVHGKIIKKGNWSISNDGQFIILNHPENPLNYLEIIEAEKGKLIIGQTVELRVYEDSNDFISYDCIIELK